MDRTRAEPTSDVEVVVRGELPAEARTDARTLVNRLARYTGKPILHARVRLSRSHDPAVPRPVVAQGNLDVNGRLIRAQVSAPTVGEAIDRLHDRLRERLLRLSQHWEARRGGLPSVEPHEWRHASEPAHRPDYYPRPEEERAVIRHKTYELAWATPDEAALDLDLMDYDFHLFTDIETGQDSVIYRAGPTGYRLAQVLAVPGKSWRVAVPLTVSVQDAPRLTLAGAIVRLGAIGLPFLFYASAETGRGQVLYRRYDGHYGLITPSGGARPGGAGAEQTGTRADEPAGRRAGIGESANRPI